MPPQKGNGIQKARAQPDPNKPKAPNDGKSWPERDLVFLMSKRLEPSQTPNGQDTIEKLPHAEIARVLGRTPQSCRLKHFQTMRKATAMGLENDIIGFVKSGMDKQIPDDDDVEAPVTPKKADANSSAPETPVVDQPSIASSPISPRTLPPVASNGTWSQTRSTYFPNTSFPSAPVDSARTYQPAVYQPAALNNFLEPDPFAYHQRAEPRAHRRSYADDIFDGKSRQLPVLGRADQSVFRSNRPAEDHEFRNFVLPPLNGLYGVSRADSGSLSPAAAVSRANDKPAQPATGLDYLWLAAQNAAKRDRETTNA